MEDTTKAVLIKTKDGGLEIHLLLNKPSIRSWRSMVRIISPEELAADPFPIEMEMYNSGELIKTGIPTPLD